MEQNSSVGYLIVNVSTARGAIPLAGASVTVMFEEPDNSSIFTVMTTDLSGKTDKLELPAPDRALSEAPGTRKPYATYTITAEKEGYYSVTNTGVPVFGGVTSIQPVEMVPRAEYDAERVFPRIGLDVTESADPNL